MLSQHAHSPEPSVHQKYTPLSTDKDSLQRLGTDAKTKAYGGGSDKGIIETYADNLGNYSGNRTELHKKFIDDKFYNETKDKAMEYYLAFVEKDANNAPFVIPEYNF